MKKILFYINMVLLLFVALSCEDNRETYKLGDSVEASFPSTMVNYLMTAEDGNKIQLEMWRGNTKGVASVPVTITDKTGGVFTAEKAQFDFVDGESKAYLTFSYPNINNFGGEKYEFEIAITDEEQVSPGGQETIKVTAQRKLTYKSLGTGTFTSNFFEDSWPQEVLKAEEADFYKLPNCYYNGYPIEFSIVDGKVQFAKQPMGYTTASYGMTSWDPIYMDESTIEGKVITFVVRFVVSAGSYGTTEEVLIMP